MTNRKATRMFATAAIGSALFAITPSFALQTGVFVDSNMSSLSTPKPRKTPKPKKTPKPTPTPVATPTPTPLPPSVSISLIDTVHASSEWGPQYYAFVKASVQNQANALAPFYAKGGVKIYGFGETAPANASPITVSNYCQFGGTYKYSAYHYYTGSPYSGHPYACAAGIATGGFWYITGLIEHEMMEMTADPFPPRNPEIVDDVEQYGGMVDPVTGVFTFNYVASIADWPFIDFDLPPAIAATSGFKDYLKQVRK